MSAAYRLKDVMHRYGERLALDVPELTLSRGELVGLVGPNGAGKSTLLQILSLLLSPTEGAVEMLGRNPWESGLDLNRKEVTLVHQRPVLFSGTVAYNIGFGLRTRGISAAEIGARVAGILDGIGLGGEGNRSSRELSGGQKQRVVLARALVLRTPILLLDEPAHGLDAEFLPTLTDLLRERVEEGSTVVLCTHDTELAASLADRVLRLSGGTLDRSVKGGR